MDNHWSIQIIAKWDKIHELILYLLYLIKSYNNFAKIVIKFLPIYGFGDYVH